MAAQPTSQKSNSTRQKPDPRGGQTPAGPKVLRVGVIQNGKIVEERILRKRESVFVGPSEKNHFVLPQEDVAASRFCLFETKGPGHPYYLNFLEGMGGKVSLNKQVVDLSKPDQVPGIQRKGKVYQVPLTEDCRGKITMGGTSILFQFVVPPPIQPKPQLPAAVKGSPFRGFELVLTICMALSFAFHGGLIAYFELNDWPEKTLEEKYQDLMELLNRGNATFEKPKEEAKSDKGEGDKAKEEEFEEVKEKPKKVARPTKQQEAEEAGPKKSAEEIAKERAERRAALAEQIAKQGINKILGSLGGEGEGVIADVLSGGDVAADQDDLLKQVQGVGVATGENSKLKGPAGGKGSGEAADISQIKAAGGDKTVKTAGPGPERKIKVSVKKKKPMASGGTGMMSPSDVAKVVNRRIGAIKGCYERALKRDPNLRGKITVRFTISGSGRVTTARTTLNELNAAVAACITGAFKRFRFPPPEGGTVTFEYPFLFTPAN